MSTLFNKNQVCERLGVSNCTLDKFIHEKLISPIKPGVSYFSIAAVENLERAGLDPEQYRPLKIKRLERELEQKSKELDEMRNVFLSMWSEALPYLNSIQLSNRNITQSEVHQQHAT